MVSLVSILSLVFAYATHHMEGAVFNLPDRLDESLATEPTIGQYLVRLKAVFDGSLDHGDGLRNFVPGAFLAPDGPGRSGVADFPILLLTLAPPQAFFGVNTQIERDKGRAVKEPQHQMFKPQHGFPEHMVEHIRDVFEMPLDPTVGRVIEDEGRMGGDGLVRIDDLLESLGDSVQNRAPRDSLLVL